MSSAGVDLTIEQGAMRHTQDHGLRVVPLVVDEAPLHPHLAITHIDREWLFVVVDLAVLDDGESTRSRWPDVLVELRANPDVRLNVDAHAAVVDTAIGDMHMSRFVNRNAGAHVGVDFAVFDRNIAAGEPRAFKGGPHADAVRPAMMDSHLADCHVHTIADGDTVTAGFRYTSILGQLIRVAIDLKAFKADVSAVLNKERAHHVLVRRAIGQSGQVNIPR